MCDPYEEFWDDYREFENGDYEEGYYWDEEEYDTTLDYPFYWQETD